MTLNNVNYTSIPVHIRGGVVLPLAISADHWNGRLSDYWLNTENQEVDTISRQDYTRDGRDELSTDECGDLSRSNCETITNGCDGLYVSQRRKRRDCRWYYVRHRD